MDPETQETLNEIWAIATTRRFKPIQTAAYENNTLDFSSVRLLRLDQEYFVVTFEGGAQQQVLLWVMVMLCPTDQNSGWNDATILLPDETAQAFFKNNRLFFVSAREREKFVECLQAGMTMEIVDRSEKGFLFKSTDRVMAYLDRWGHFFGHHQNNPNRASDFMNLLRNLEMNS